MRKTILTYKISDCALNHLSICCASQCHYWHFHFPTAINTATIIPKCFERLFLQDINGMVITEPTQSHTLKVIWIQFTCRQVIGNNKQTPPQKTNKNIHRGLRKVWNKGTPPPQPTPKKYDYESTILKKNVKSKMIICLPVQRLVSLYYNDIHATWYSISVTTMIMFLCWHYNTL